MENKFMIVGVVITISIMSFVGIILMDSVDNAGRTIAENQQSFNVANTSVDKTCNLAYDPTGSTVTVQYYNGTAWSTLTSVQYNLTGSRLVVNASAMD